MRQQVLRPAPIAWGNGLTRKLSFAAIPYRNTFYDCVTRVFGTQAGTVTYGNPVAKAGGMSTQPGVIAALSDAAATGKVEFPVSATQRGGAMVDEGTLLCLAATASQTNAKIYWVGGNTEIVTNGDGFSMAIDSNNFAGRGNLLRGSYISVVDYSVAELLTSSFGQKLHFFGYAFSGNGASGDWFADGKNTSWTGGPTHGTTTTDRRARIWAPGGTGTGARYDTYIALMMFWDRRISPHEYAELYANPWQVFAEPAMDMDWAPTAAAGGFFARQYYDRLIARMH